MARVPAGHEHASRRRADTVPGVDLREFRPLGSHPIQVRRTNLCLAVAAQMAVSEIIGHDKDDVRLALFGGRIAPATREDKRCRAKPDGPDEFTAAYLPG